MFAQLGYSLKLKVSQHFYILNEESLTVRRVHISQRGVWVSFGHNIADFVHPNIHISTEMCFLANKEQMKWNQIFFAYNAMGWKGIPPKQQVLVVLTVSQALIKYHKH